MSSQTKKRNTYTHRRNQREHSQHPELASLYALANPKKHHTESKFSKLKANIASTFSIIFVAALAIVSVWAICQGMLWLYSAAQNSSFFTTKHIDITGNVRLDRAMVLEYANLHEGDNCFKVSIGEIERKLCATPWVAEASVKRILPDRFVIRLKERLPSFWIRKENGLFYANEYGNIIAPVESKNFLSLPTLQIEPGTEDMLPYLARLMTDLKAGDLPIELGSIASVSVTAAKGIEIYLDDRELYLSIATADWTQNITHLAMTLNDLAKRQELRNVREIRSFDNSVWVISNTNSNTNKRK